MVLHLVRGQVKSRERGVGAESTRNCLGLGAKTILCQVEVNDGRVGRSDPRERLRRCLANFDRFKPVVR
jgi:hypothetical protein